MDLDEYLKNVFLRRADEYEALFPTEFSVRREWVKRVAEITLSGSFNAFVTVLAACQHDDRYVHLLEPIFVTQTPNLSRILKTSQIFRDDCRVYVPGCVSAWTLNNSELFETEVPFFRNLLAMYGEYVGVDCAKYSAEKLTGFVDAERVSGQTEAEKLKQLYTVIYYYEELVDD